MNTVQDMEQAAAGLDRNWIREVTCLDEVTSTNTLALQSTMIHNRLIWGRLQTAGRGRGKNIWKATHGCLTFSLMLPNPGVEAHEIPRISLVNALAVADAIQPWTPAQLKWPNDVYTRDRKICGILAEAHPDGGLVIGTGINISNPVDDILPAAINLETASSQTVPMGEVLLRWATLFQELLELFIQDRLELDRAWQPRCWLTGCTVRFDDGLSGSCLGITADGGLRLKTATGEEVRYGGVIVSVS